MKYIILMDKYKIKLKDFLSNPTGMIFESRNKKPTLEELQPIIIYSKNGGKDKKCLTTVFDFLNIEYYVNPSFIEAPVKGYPIYLDEIELIY
jgi:hypothetical protein